MQDDLFIEMLDVYLQSIMYVRGLYPEAIFRRRRIYNTAVHVSIFPPLNEYLKEILTTIQQLKETRNLHSVELVIFCEEPVLFGCSKEEIVEKYIFYVEPDQNARQIDLSSFLLKFENDLRSGLIQLNDKVKHLKKLDADSCSFRIQLDTTDSAYFDLTHKGNSEYVVCSMSQFKMREF